MISLINRLKSYSGGFIFKMELWILLAILILMSSFFSATETAFLSLNRIRMKNMANDGNKKAKTVIYLVDQYDTLLSTILIGNNIVNIASASISTVLFTGIFGDSGVTISTIFMTIIVLIFGEITPKSLAKDFPEVFAMFAAPIIKFLSVVLMPINNIFAMWKKIVSTIFKSSDSRGITEEELITIVEEATQEGGIDAREGELIRSAIEFNELDATDILTPRIDIVGVEENSSIDEINKIFNDSEYSRLPVYKETIDNIIGVIHLKDLHYHNSPTTKGLIKDVVYTTQTIQISTLLHLLQTKKSHLAVVCDEYGGTLGIVTLEDIIEELVGEIWDEHDEVIKEFEKINDNHYKITCSANLDKMFKLFGVDKEVVSSTVSGWVIEEIGGIPEVNDTFDFENLHIVVTETDFKRVLEIEVFVKDDSEKNTESD